MKLIRFFIFILLVLNSVVSIGQTELEIKTTGKFLYSWAIENNEPKARENAKLGLLDTIFISIARESAIDKTDTVFIKVIDYFVKQVGFKWQAIAFADKADIKIKLEQRNQLKVIPVIFGDQSKQNTDNDKLVAQVSKVDVVKKKISNPDSKVEKKTDSILTELLLISDGKELLNRLSKFKADLKLNYGSKSHYPNDSECYIFILENNSNHVLAVYDKGSDTRMNMLSNQFENNYIEKYRENRFIYVVIN